MVIALFNPIDQTGIATDAPDHNKGDLTAWGRSVMTLLMLVLLVAGIGW